MACRRTCLVDACQRKQNGGQNSQNALRVSLDRSRFLRGWVGNGSFQVVWRTDLEVDLERNINKFKPVLYRLVNDIITLSKFVGKEPLAELKYLRNYYDWEVMSWHNHFTQFVKTNIFNRCIVLIGGDKAESVQPLRPLKKIVSCLASTVIYQTQWRFVG